MTKLAFTGKCLLSALEFKASKDHITLILGGNAATDIKQNPMIIYFS